MISFAEAHRRLDYDPASGIFTWKLSPRRGWAGKIAGTIMNNGYVMIEIDGEPYLAHLLAWFMTHGEWPSVQLDHRDTDRSNNPITNLRLATEGQNRSNVGVRRDSTSGCKGVTFNKRAARWTARIQANGKRLFLGYFENLQDASDAYKRAADKHHGNFARY